jgi:hypothetical protein
MRWAGRVALLGKMMYAYDEILVGKHEGKRPLEDPDIDWRKIIRLILEEDCGISLDFSHQWRVLVNREVNFRVQ